MNRRKVVIRNVVLLVVLSYLFFNVSGLYLSPTSAHERSEQSFNYGPSEIVHVENYPGGKLFLGKYDRWISCNPVLRKGLVFWRFGSGPAGFEYDVSKPLDYTWGSDSGFYRLYGIVNDRTIGRVETVLTDGTVISQTDFYDNLFLFTWEGIGANEPYPRFVRGYDAQGNLVFEEKSPGEK